MRHDTATVFEDVLEGVLFDQTAQGLVTLGLENPLHQKTVLGE
jgi:hypothetical protein